MVACGGGGGWDGARMNGWGVGGVQGCGWRVDGAGGRGRKGGLVGVLVLGVWE